MPGGVWKIAGLTLMLVAGVHGQSTGQRSGPWVLEESGTKAGLRGVQSLGGGLAWASGADGTILRTEDGGYEWQRCPPPPDAEKLDFRGIWAWDSNTAVVMSSGTGDQSRVYRTTDGAHWTLVLSNPDKEGFFDAVVFSSREVGYVLGDPVDGAFTLFRTGDGGATWTRVQSPGLATAAKGSGAFAASNSALTAAGGAEDGKVWFVTGGEAGAFLYEGTTGCAKGEDVAADSKCLNQWMFDRKPLPVAGGSASAGAFSLRLVVWNGRVKAGVAVGGDYAKADATEGTSVWTPDGRTWAPSEAPPHGFRSAVSWDADRNVWIAVGTNGSDVSWDGGRHWKLLDGTATGGSWNALSLPFVVGPGGRIGKINLDELQK
ncbi:MAG: WD40/YVTN/BNR-like repeat-containing protein [Acidobacteriota bacterium]